MGHSGGGVALYALAILTIAALVSSVLLWQRVTNMQEQLARHRQRVRRCAASAGPPGAALPRCRGRVPKLLFL